MLTTKDFIEKFNKYTDEELAQMLHSIEGYSNEAKEALHHVIETKGGMNRLSDSITKSQQVANETKRVEKEIYELTKGGFDQEFIKKAVSSNLLSDENIQEIISKHYTYATNDIHDKSVDKQTIGRCVMAGIIATLVSGCALGALLIFTHAIHALIFVGVALLCYAVIYGVVKKSKNNSAVIVTTIISTILAIALGQLLFILLGNIL